MTQTKTERRIRSLIDAAKSICPTDLEAELELTTTKWFEYRFMSPWAATLLFAQKYKEAFRASFRENVDRDRATKVRGTKLSKFELERRELTQMWKARQRADAVGMRYEEYLDRAFDFAMRRQRQRLPRPNQLHYSDNSRLAWNAHVLDYWKKCLEDHIIHVTDQPAFQMENYEGLPAQDAYRNFILDGASKSSQPLHRWLRTYALERRQVPLDVFESSVSQGHFKQAQESLASDVGTIALETEPLPNGTPDMLWQSCFGLPHARDPHSPLCSTCPQSAKCARLADLVLAKVQAECATADPIGDRRRAFARARKQRQRKRQNAVKGLLVNLSHAASLPAGTTRTG